MHATSSHPDSTTWPTNSTSCAATATLKGRDYDTITKTMLSRSDPADVDAVVDEMRAFAKLGIDKVIFVPSGDPVAFTQSIGGELAARLEDL